MLAFLSTAVLVPVAVVTWGQTGTFVLLWVGWILGGVCAYTIARHFGRPVVGVLTSGEALAYGDRISKEAPFGLILWSAVAALSLLAFRLLQKRAGAASRS